jgi:hypothetical protein
MDVKTAREEQYTKYTYEQFNSLYGKTWHNDNFSLVFSSPICYGYSFSTISIYTLEYAGFIKGY